MVYLVGFGLVICIVLNVVVLTMLRRLGRSSDGLQNMLEGSFLQVQAGPERVYA